MTRIIRITRPPKNTEPLPSLMPMEPVIWHETGGWTVGWRDGWTVGWRDDAKDFPSPAFAIAAWLRRNSKHLSRFTGAAT